VCLQIPSSWRSLIEDPATLQLFLDYYNSTSLPGSAVALDCLVRLASVRRSLFSSEGERSKFLNRLVNGTRDILRNHAGLQHHENYHQACRLLGRLKTNYQLAELVGGRGWGGPSSHVCIRGSGIWRICNILWRCCCHLANVPCSWRGIQTHAR
jgi:exportin-7